jgi:hypothetical protein
MVGPDMRVQPPRTVHLDDSQLTVHPKFTGKYHEWNNRDDEYEAAILPNPGLGHPHLSRDWEATLEMILCDNSFILLTAHSLKDAERDYQTLTTKYGVNLPDYKENLWASKITYLDPFDNQHVVRPNHYVTVIDKGK